MAKDKSSGSASGGAPVKFIEDPQIREAAFRRLYRELVRELSQMCEEYGTPGSISAFNPDDGKTYRFVKEKKN